MEEDYCHWKDEGDSGTMYLRVEGNGEYKIKIEMDEDDGKLPLYVICLIAFATLLFLLGLLSGIYLIIRYFGKKNPIDEIDGKPPDS